MSIRFGTKSTKRSKDIQVVTPKDKLEYKYDPLGRRTARTVNGATTNYVYDGQDIIAELDAAGTPINTYTNGPGIDEPLIMTKPDGKNYYYHADALGSITAITDDSRKLVETYTYKSYGQPTIRDAKGQAIPTSIIGNTRMFAAREYEPEIGLYNNRHRYLDPGMGAFTQEDPIEFNGGDINLYRYVFGSPGGYIDPIGLFLFPWETPVKIEGGSVFEQGEIKSAANAVFSTTLGKEYLTEIVGPWYRHGNPVTIWIQCSEKSGATAGYNVIRFNLQSIPSLLVKDKMGNIHVPSITRVLAHEMGHSVGRISDEQVVIDSVENPIMSQITGGTWERATHGGTISQ